MRIRYGSGGATTPWSTEPACQGAPFEAEFFEPGPPFLELMDLLDGLPQVFRSGGELERMLILDDRPTWHGRTR